MTSGGVGSDAVLGLITLAGATLIRTYLLITRNTPIAFSPDLPLYNTQVVESHGWTTIYFTRPIVGGKVPIVYPGQNKVIFAVGGADILTHHLKSTKTVIDFSVNQSVPLSPPATPTPPTNITNEPAPQPVIQPFSTILASQGYNYSKELIPNLLTLYWKPIKKSSTTISFALSGITTGYVAVGWSPDNTMVPADVIAGWVDSSGAYVGTYSNLEYSTPQPTLNLTITDEWASELNGVTTIYFTRPLKSGLYPISKNASNGVIGAVGARDELTYHGSFRTEEHENIQINFLNPFNIPIVEPSSRAQLLISQGYTYSQVLIPNLLTVYWKPVTDTNTTVYLAVEGITTGYVAIGWSPSGHMSPADSVIAWVASDGTVFGTYYHKSTTLPQHSSLLTINDTFATEIDGVTTIYFSRPLDSGVFPIESGFNGVIGAVGIDDKMRYHGSSRTDSTTKILIDFVGGIATTTPIPPPTLRLSHGVIMFFSWGVLIPFGAFFARFGRHLPGALWFRVHRITQPLSCFFAFVAIIIAFVMVEGNHFRTLFHGQLGVAIMLLCLIQVVIAIFRPPKEVNKDPSKKRKVFDYFHWWVGRVLVVLGLFNCFGGIMQLEGMWMSGGLMVMGGVVVVYVVVFVALEVRAVNTKEPDVVPFLFTYQPRQKIV
eukprot:TRINITY_DN3114_c0_g1_i1.p1 TRINITY_DN3114_c0_g1~~TRINITY_DN3114_c0_g1_i1.p1  ORF type:complete len:702 (-),score=118.02 TRINITY_DN3114_c0_g1_i1:13-1986(-)